MFVKSEKWRSMQKYICTYTNKQVNLRMKTRYAMTPEKLKDIIARREGPEIEVKLLFLKIGTFHIHTVI